MGLYRVDTDPESAPRMHHNGTMRAPEPLTFVTVVFGAEARLLELQARSLALYADPDAVGSIVVINNGWRDLTPSGRARLLASYGRLADRVTIVRTGHLIPDLPPTIGWRSQQIAKLLIARSVDTPHYIVLDAKNHLVRAAGRADFVGADGRAHGGTHTYLQHPLKPQLVSALRYLGASETVIESSLRDFPPTAPPFVIDTAVTRTMLDEIETASGVTFAREFERQRLTEFFLYSGWITVRGPGVDALYDRVPIPSPTVWPRRGHSGGVDATIAEAEEDDSAFFAVHRQALARGDRRMRRLIAQFWTRRGLFPRESAALRYIGAFRRAYVVGMVAKKVAERAGALRHS
ncbi:hypothetical protein BH11ACT3_BH11ACT3_17360 [soil metagenome]